MKTTVWIAVFGIATLGAQAARGKSCQDVLDHNQYDCQFVQDTGQTFGGCMRFVTPGT